MSWKSWWRPRDGLPTEGLHARLDGCLGERWFAAAWLTQKDRNRGRFVAKSRSLGGTKVSSSGPPNVGFFGSDKRSSPLGSHCDNGLRHRRGLFFSDSHRNRGA